MHRPRLPVPSDRALLLLRWLVGVALIVAAVGAIVALSQFAGRLDAYSIELERADLERAAIEATNDDQATAILDQQRALREANKRCRDAAGCTPVPTPPVVVAGATGSAGPRGFLGEDGEQGLTGPRGPRGFTGPTGEDGPAGKAGEPGLPGTTGTTGPAGERGQQGPKGDAGARGDDGVQGPAGPQGPPGNPGATGSDGAPGRGISSVSCDALTPMTLTVTYSDDTAETYTCTAPPSGQ